MQIHQRVEVVRTAQLVTHRLSNSLHLHGGALHQIESLPCHGDCPATAETKPHKHTENQPQAMTKECQIHSDMQILWALHQNNGRRTFAYIIKDNHQHSVAHMPHYCEDNSEEMLHIRRILLWRVMPLMHERCSLLLCPWFCFNACVTLLPEVALGGFDEEDGGVLLVGVDAAKIISLTGEVFKLHTHTQRGDMGLPDCRHGAFNDIICFPVKSGTWRNFKFWKRSTHYSLYC